MHVQTVVITIVHINDLSFFLLNWNIWAPFSILCKSIFYFVQILNIKQIYMILLSFIFKYSYLALRFGAAHWNILWVHL